MKIWRFPVRTWCARSSIRSVLYSLCVRSVFVFDGNGRCVSGFGDAHRGRYTVLAISTIIAFDLCPCVIAHGGAVRLGEVSIGADVCAGGFAGVGGEGRAAVVAVFQVHVWGFAVCAGGAGGAVGAVLNGLRMRPIFVGNGDGGGVAGFGYADRRRHAVNTRVTLCARHAYRRRSSRFRSVGICYGGSCPDVCTRLPSGVGVSPRASRKFRGRVRFVVALRHGCNGFVILLDFIQLHLHRFCGLYDEIP